MISTENRSFSTAFTVNETPSSATEPFCAMKRDKLRRRAERQPRHVGQILALDQFGEPIDVAGDDVAAEFVADLERTLQIDRRPGLPCADRGDRQRLGGRIDLEDLAIAAHCPWRPRSGTRPSTRSTRRDRSHRHRKRTRSTAGAGLRPAARRPINSPTSLTIPVNIRLSHNPRCGQRQSPHRSGARKRDALRDASIGNPSSAFDPALADHAVARA